ncbi:MAG: EF-P 5-aminopentanol modification-associated protein YfmF [Planctomycetota bacterium]|jgi:predicted Zn-dependent peptidase
MVSFQRIDNTSSYNLFYSPTKKFKTTTIRAFFKGSLSRDVEEQAMLPFLLKRGSSKYPTLKEISRRLEGLYGSILSLDITKMGEMQVFVASMDLVNPRYVKDETNLLPEAFDLFNDVLMNPFLDEGAFPQDRFNQEKLNLDRHIRSVIDDKAAYTHLRLIREMFKGEPYSHYEWGDLQKVAELDRGKVLETYRTLLDTAPVDVYVVGRLSEAQEESLTDLIPFETRHDVADPVIAEKKVFADNEVICEEQPLEQSKLEMGFRVDVDCGKDNFYALVLYNALLGGGSFSKLFKRVREEASMAYYASSAFDKLKGFLYIAAGINTDVFEKVTGLIGNCMDEIADRQISDKELENAKKSILNGLRSIADSPHQMIDFDHIARTAGIESDIERIAEIIQGISKDQVSEVTRLIYPGKTFFLKGMGCNNDLESH